jgi:hypothetical protein
MLPRRENKRAHNALGSQRSAPTVGLCRPERRPRNRPLPTHIPYATLNLLLKHLIVAIYKRKQIKQFKQAYETLAKMPEKHLKNIANICSIKMKHSHHMYETSENKHMLATCMYMQHPNLLCNI